MGVWRRRARERSSRELGDRKIDTVSERGDGSVTVLCIFGESLGHGVQTVRMRRNTRKCSESVEKCRESVARRERRALGCHGRQDSR